MTPARELIRAGALGTNMKKPRPHPLFIILTFLLLPVLSLQTIFAQTAADLQTQSTLLPAWTSDGVDNGVDYGISVASAGDINGDGYADIVIGAQKYLVGGQRCGSAFVYLGGPGGLPNSAHSQLMNADPGTYFGNAVSGAGDVNGDGYADVLIGASHYHLNSGYEGAVYLYTGSAEGISAQPAWTMVGPMGDAQFGYAVSSAGDVNGDGYDDILIGARNYSMKSSNEGAAFLYLGNPSGPQNTAVWQISGGQTGALLGHALAGLGDINHDGYADFAVSAPNFDQGELDTGLVMVFLGSETGPSLSPTWSATGTQADERLGSAVASAGDVDGNGYTDLIVGARGYDSGTIVDAGAAYLFYNTAGSLSPTAAWMTFSDQTYSGFGIAVTGFGDVNNDGYADVGVGAHRYTDDQSEEGFVFVYRGSSAGAENNPYWSASGNKAETQFGYAISGAGDVNADERDDLLIGAPIYKHDEKTVMGRAYSFYGIAASDVTHHTVFLPVIQNNP
jgi:hypothetical protein